MFFLLCNVFLYVSLLLNFWMTFTVHPWVLGNIRHLRTLRNIERWVHQSISEELLTPFLQCKLSTTVGFKVDILVWQLGCILWKKSVWQKKQVLVSLNKNLASKIKPKSVLEKFPRATGLGGAQAEIMQAGDLNSLWTERRVLERTGGENQEDADAAVRC